MQTEFVMDTSVLLVQINTYQHHSKTKVAMYVGSTAGESFVAKGAKEAGFEYGVAVRPEKQHLQQGTDIYMFEGSTTEEQRTPNILILEILIFS